MKRGWSVASYGRFSGLCLWLYAIFWENEARDGIIYKKVNFSFQNMEVWIQMKKMGVLTPKQLVGLICS